MSNPDPGLEPPTQSRHPVTGRYMAGDCERDCLDHCAGVCGVDPPTESDDDNELQRRRTNDD